MADGVFNVSKGKVAEYVTRVDGNDPTNSAIIAVLLKGSPSDADLEDYADLDGVLNDIASAEADFTSYARITVTDTGVTAPTPDNTNNWQYATLDANPTWSSAGGTTDNNLVKLILCYDPDTTAGTDANIVPLTYHDFVKTTDGTDLIAQLDAGGFHRST